MKDASLAHPTRIEPLGNQNRAAFSCGNDALDKYLLERAHRDAAARIAAVFVLLREDGSIAGYYTLSAQEIDAGTLPLELTKKLGKYKRVPATLIGRLAVDKSLKGKGVGAFLLMDALKRALEASHHVASFAVVVDAKDQSAAGFYAKYGFKPLQGNRLFLPMKTIAQL